jgi:hypothetical protein
MNELILFASNCRLTLSAAAGDRAQTRFLVILRLQHPQAAHGAIQVQAK